MPLFEGLCKNLVLGKRLLHTRDSLSSLQCDWWTRGRVIGSSVHDCATCFCPIQVMQKSPTRTQALEAHPDPRLLTQEPRRNLLQLVARDARRRDRTRIAAPTWPGRGFRRGTERGHEERGGNAP